MSDPGYELIVAASQQGIPVVPIPGPSAIITALAISGLPTDRFTCVGFPPNKTKARQHFLESMASEQGTIIVLEAPHRLLATLDDMMRVFGDRKVAICRELTKLHEEVFRGTISEAIRHFARPRGEFTIVIEGKREKSKPEITADIERILHNMQQAGSTAKEAIAKISEETGISKKTLYQAWLRLDKSWDTEKDSCQTLGRSD